MQFTNKSKKGVKNLNFYKKEKDKKENALNVKLDLEKGRELRDLRVALRKAVNLAKRHKHFDLSLDLEQFSEIDIDREKIVEEVVVQFAIADYAFDKYKTNKKDRIKTLCIMGAQKGDIDKAQKISDALLYARDLANTPGSDMTPQVLAKEAQNIARNDKRFKLKIFKKKDLQKMGAGALLAVGSASKHEPLLVDLEYNGSKKSGTDIVFVGKGITFDSGGLDIKPAGKFTDMYQDMSGSGALLALARLVSSMKLDKNIAFVIPSAENAVGPDSYRPGDIIKTLSGKTVEIGHTDAEGRLVLADGIAYAQKYSAPLLITVATLTGAALVALGQEASAVMSSDEELAFAIKEWSEGAGDYVWPLPLWKEYANIMKGTFADLNNVQNAGSQSYGGTVTAGAFLHEFAKDAADTFVHIDMAPRMIPGPNDSLPKEGGALGGPVRMLFEIIKNKA